eukprot:c8279_g1_i2.p1 GENE.c8279_g1_i2~~c8279_g1_i2.p1  ORF type:complete len:118 (-),score=30.06 c8279_g1_i2:38-391(-)
MVLVKNSNNNFSASASSSAPNKRAGHGGISVMCHVLAALFLAIAVGVVMEADSFDVATVGSELCGSSLSAERKVGGALMAQAIGALVHMLCAVLAMLPLSFAWARGESSKPQQKVML